MDIVNQLVNTIGAENIKYILIALIIFAIIAIIAKAIKLAVTIILIAVIGVFIVKPVAEDIGEKYSFRIEDGVGIISIEDKDYRLSKEECEGITFEELDDVHHTMTIVMEGNDIELDIPSVLVGGIERFAESQEIPVEIHTDTGE